jgi:hypothetical protein
MAGMPKAAWVLAAQSMAVDQTTCEVVTAFRRADIATVLLKGPSIAQWLYPAGDRPYGDSDLLVDPHEFSRAADVLRHLGFGEPVRGHTTHAHTYQRTAQPGGSPCHVDLHRNLPFLSVSNEEAWRVLSTGTDEIRLGELAIPVLGLAPRVLHIAIHAVQHAFESTKPFEDLRRAILVLDPETWPEVVALSRRLGAEDALAAGLCLIPEGKVLATQLQLTQRRRGVIRIATTPGDQGPAGEVQRVLEAASFGEGLQVIFDGITLSPTVMRRDSPLARRSRGGLVLAYAIRPLQLARRLGPALVTRQRILKSR